MRIRLFEFEDLSWFPQSIREGGTDYLRYLLNALGFYKPVIPVLSAALSDLNETNILDLCSGGGGSIQQIYEGLNRDSRSNISIALSDKYPNSNAYRYLSERTNGGITFINSPVDAENVPATISGLRTMFSATHHFEPDGIRAILKNAVENNKGIALFDGGNKHAIMLIAVLLVHPAAFILFTPFFRPFKFSRLFFTYLLPLIPLMTIWDGCVSILRLYKPEELLSIANSVESDRYSWKAGKAKSKFGMSITYLVGCPNDKANFMVQN